MLIVKEIEFLESIDELISEYRILPSKYNNTSDRDAKRIAILIGEKFLSLWSNEETNRFQIAADYLMTEIYDGAKKLKLTCDPTLEEERFQELHIFGFDPLKISITRISGEAQLLLDILLKLKEVESGNSKFMGRKTNSVRNVSIVSKL